MNPNATSFWCSKCRFPHPGECSPAPIAPTQQIVLRHDWVAQTVYDLTISYQCSACGKGVHFTLVQVMVADKDGTPLPFPFDACPGRP